MIKPSSLFSTLRLSCNSLCATAPFYSTFNSATLSLREVCTHLFTFSLFSMPGANIFFFTRSEKKRWLKSSQKLFKQCITQLKIHRETHCSNRHRLISLIPLPLSLIKLSGLKLTISLILFTLCFIFITNLVFVSQLRSYRRYSRKSGIVVCKITLLIDFW